MEEQVPAWKQALLNARRKREPAATAAVGGNERASESAVDLLHRLNHLPAWKRELVLKKEQEKAAAAAANAAVAADSGKGNVGLNLFRSASRSAGSKGEKRGEVGGGGGILR